MEAHESEVPGRRRGSSAITLILLFLALATAFLFDGSRGQPGSRTSATYHHWELTRDHMTVALNMSPEHGFLGFLRLTYVGDGDLAYVPYNRFPVLGYALIKLAMLPFPDDFAAREAAARTLMMVFFAAAATLAHLALCRLTGSRWTALAATLLAFSSYYALYYRDMVATEGVVDLFGTMLVLHGMAVFATDGRFGQLLAKTCVALLLGWHVYALLLPFVALGLVAALRYRDWRGGRRHLTLGVVALAFGALVLAANFVREYLAFDGEVAATQLPSVESMLMRTGLAESRALDSDAPPEYVSAWPVAAVLQLKRIAWSVPYAVGHFFGVGRPIADLVETRVVAVLGSVVLSALVVATTCVLFLSPAVRHRLPLAALALTGPCWAFALRNQHYHPFEGLFGVGIPLVFFALALPCLDRLLGGRVGFSVLAGVVSVPMFALSCFLMVRATAADPEEVLRQRAWAADVDAIREQVEEGKAILVSERIDGCSPERRIDASWRYYFAGYATVKFSDRRLADFVVSEQRIEGARTLTPDNRLMFLYDRASHAAALSRYERYAKQAVPVLDFPDYDIYLVEGGAQGRNELLYLRDQCPNHQIHDGLHSQLVLMGGGRVFAHVWPADANDLSAARRPFGFDAPVDFQRHLLGWQKDGKCYAVCGLPDYGTAKVRAGSLAGDRTSQVVAWEGGFSLDSAGGEASGSAAAADEPRPLPSPGTDTGTRAPRVQVEEEPRVL